MTLLVTLMFSSAHNTMLMIPPKFIFSFLKVHSNSIIKCVFIIQAKLVKNEILFTNLLKRLRKLTMPFGYTIYRNKVLSVEMS